jgi:hypothetical protein
VTVDTRALRGHAERISADQVRRVSGRLAGLGPAQRTAVEELARSIGRSIADELAAQARRDARLAAALAGIATDSGRSPPG